MDKVYVYSLPVVSTVQPGPLNLARRLVTEAGEMAQISNQQTIRYVAHVQFQFDPNTEPIARGNHLHKNKTEFIYVVEGKLRGVFKDADSGELRECELEVGDLVITLPRCAHAYLPQRHTSVIEYSTWDYDPEDTYRFPLDFSQSHPILEKLQGYAFDVHPPAL